MRLLPIHLQSVLGAPALRQWWGGGLLHARARSSLLIDVVGLLVLAGVAFLLWQVGAQWDAPFRPAIDIDLSPWALPWYATLSLARGLVAYALSLSFALMIGLWAVHDRRAGRVLLPMLDILQSIPVLGFMPGLVLAMVALFPHSNLGLEVAAILMIFTGQVWNLVFSVYRSVQGVPTEAREAAAVFGFSFWRTVRCIELPSAVTGLVWNSMMSVAGGWFFLMVSEAFTLGDRDYRLPGLGSYLSVAASHGDVAAQLYGVAAMLLMIVVLDQVLWRPLLVWAHRYRGDDGGVASTPSSWVVTLLRRSRLRRSVVCWWRRRALARQLKRPPPLSAVIAPTTAAPVAAVLSSQPHALLAWLPVAVLTTLLLCGAVALVHLVLRVPGHGWLTIAGATGLTLMRVTAAIVLGTVWALPVGLAIGLSPRWSRRLQPVIQAVASFPAPMLFPLTVLGLHALGVDLGVGSVVLMLLGTQWYILFNVIAGAAALPGPLREVSAAYGLRGWRRFRTLLLPAVFPALVTGWVTAAGGAWNASIVAEFLTLQGSVVSTPGLGSLINRAAATGDVPLLVGGVLAMAAVVVLINRTLWRWCYHLAETRFRIEG